MRAGAAAQSPVTMATGTPDGMYWELASTMAAQEPALGIHPVPTSGSAQNLEMLEAGRVRFALAQQDMVRDYFRKRRQTQVRVVGRVFFDYLHILVRESIHLSTASDLGRLRIWIGEPGSGDRLTASRFFDSLGMPISTLAGTLPRSGLESRPEELSLTRSGLTRAFREDRIDGALLVTTPGASGICSLMASETVSLRSLDPKALRQLTQEEETTLRKQIAIGRIPANVYPHQPEPVATISVPVLLLAKSGEDWKTAYSLLLAVQRAWSRLAQESARATCRIPDSVPQAAPLSVSGLTMLKDIPVDRQGWPWFRLIVMRVVPLFAVAILGVWGWRRGWHQKLKLLWRQDRLPFLLVWLLAFGIGLVTVTTFFFERGINENFSTLGESFWSITVYLFSGLEDRTPYTDEGRIVATFGLLLGPALFAVLSGWFARVFMRREKRMPHNLKDHFLLLNWNARAADVVRELHHPIIREREGTFVVVVLTDDESMELRRFKEAGSGRDEAFEDFYISVGDPTDERALRNANAADARCILILTDDAHGDDRTIRSILMLRKIAREVGRNDLHVVAELSDSANITVLEELAEDFPGLLEPIAGLQIRTFLLSQAALSAGIVGFYSELLKISPVTNEMYTLDLPPGAIGMTFRDYAAIVLQTYPDEPLVPVGVQRIAGGRARMITNPRRGDPGWVLERGDCLLVMAYLPPLPGALPEPREATLRSA